MQGAIKLDIASVRITITITKQTTPKQFDYIILISTVEENVMKGGGKWYRARVQKTKRENGGIKNHIYELL